ncbi:MAG: Hsp20/alpha crystallin family protein [Alphaproteobacteria bacterium PRO2]|nr:Hsp20/alpha crystallin family protein [Alphaproteobacteria bacterium PRO2]
MARTAPSERNQRNPQRDEFQRERSQRDRSEKDRPDRNRQENDQGINRNLMRAPGEIAGNMDNFMSPFLDMHRQMNRMMENMFSSMTDQWQAPMAADKMMPKVRVWEDSDAFHLMTRLPQDNPDNIEVAINDNVLTLRWHEDQRQDDGPHQFFRSHDAYRTVMIPDNADPEKAEAICENGSLEVIVPKRQDAGKNARSIPIRRMGRQ